MKTKNQKREEAIARNAKHRNKYLNEAEERGLVGFDAKEFADCKQGLSSTKSAANYSC